MVGSTVPDLTVWTRLLDRSGDTAVVVSTRGLTSGSIDIGEQEILHLLQLVP